MVRTMVALRTLVFAAILASAGYSTAAHAENYGVWRNPKNSVHVEIRDCGDRTCGYVVWANEHAKKDAREGGTENLVGLQLFRDFKKVRDNYFRGRVFVPDLNRTFSGSAEFVDDTTLKAKGCLIGNILCKSQTWRKVDRAA